MNPKLSIEIMYQNASMVSVIRHNQNKAFCRFRTFPLTKLRQAEEYFEEYLPMEELAAFALVRLRFQGSDDKQESSTTPSMARQ